MKNSMTWRRQRSNLNLAKRLLFVYFGLITLIFIVFLVFEVKSGRFRIESVETSKPLIGAVPYVISTIFTDTKVEGASKEILALIGSIERHVDELDKLRLSESYDVSQKTYVYIQEKDISKINPGVLNSLDRVFVEEARDKTENESLEKFVRNHLLRRHCGWAEVSMYIDESHSFTEALSVIVEQIRIKNDFIVYDGEELVFYGVSCPRYQPDGIHIKLSLRDFSLIKKTQINDKPGYLTDLSFLRFVSPNASLIDILSFNLGFQRYPRNSRERTLALLVPTTSRGVEDTSDISKFPIVSVLLSSFSAVYVKEADFWTRVVLYVGYDDTDDYYKHAKNRKEMLKYMLSIFERPRFEVRFVAAHKFEHKPAWHWNLLSQVAYFDGCDYMYQLNDDSRFKKGGIIKMMNLMDKNRNRRNIGVMAPETEWTERMLLIFAMVHRTHVEIFGGFYPSFFHNWYSDDWITNTYGAEATNIVKGTYVENVKTASATRYSRSPLSRLSSYDREQLLLFELRISCARTNYYLGLHNHELIDCNYGWSVIDRPLSFIE